MRAVKVVSKPRDQVVAHQSRVRLRLNSGNACHLSVFRCKSYYILIKECQKWHIAPETSDSSARLRESALLPRSQLP